jgi:transcriptional regulator with XRE-family HTH domain
MTDEDLLGRRLRSERERRRITLESIAANTKISIGLLRDLERDDVSRWPSGIFRRSFIRDYAEAIGLDGDDLVREFLERYPDAQHLKTRAAARLAGGARSGGRPQTVLRLKLADAPHPFSGGPLLARAAGRLAAAACDAGATLALALVAYLFIDAFWIPLGAVTLCYYAGGVLILGNTPGVCLLAPRPGGDNPGSPTSDARVDDLGLHGLIQDGSSVRL